MKIHELTNAQKKDGDPGETNDSSDQVHLSLSTEPSKTDESEEKKESRLEHDETSSETLPQTPPPRPLSRINSVSSIYETPNPPHLDINDLRELDPGEVLATKLLNVRLPLFKTKDALEVSQGTLTFCVVEPVWIFCSQFNVFPTELSVVFFS
jgi:hypothetical protein